MGNNLNCTARLDRDVNKATEQPARQQVTSSRLASPISKRAPVIKRIAAASGNEASASRDHFVPTGLNVYDSLWDMSPDSDDDAGDSENSQANESGIASRSSTTSRSSARTATPYTTPYATPSTTPFAPTPMPFTPATYTKNASLHKTDSLLKRLSWGSEFAYAFGTDGYGDSSCLSIDNNNGSACCYNNRFTSRPLSPWKGEYYEASTREFAQTRTSHPVASLDATFDFSFSALRDDDDDDDVAGDLYMTRCLASLDRILAQAVEVLCYEIDPEVSIQVMKQRLLITNVQHKRLRNRQQMAETVLATFGGQPTSVMLEVCEAIIKKSANNNKLKNFFEALLCLLNFVVRYTAETEHLISQQHQQQHHLSTQLEVLDVFASPEFQHQSSFELKGNTVDDEKPSADFQLMYLDTNCDRLKTITDALSVKKRKLTHEAFFGNHVSVSHEADKYVPVISLALFAYSLNQSEAAELRSIFRSYPATIVELSLKKCRVADETWQQLFTGLNESAKSLQSVDLHLSPIPNEVISKFARSLRYMTFLRRLNVAGVTSSKDALIAVVKSVASCHLLTNIDLSFCQVENAGATLLSDMMERGCALTSLRLRNAHIRRDGAQKLICGIKKHPCLTHFDIGGNQLGTEALSWLGEYLICNRSVRDITADDCGFSSDGCDILSRALKTNNVLLHLDISRNRIGDYGSNLIADSLKYNTSLVSLGLNFCDIGDLGFSSLLDSLLFNIRLTTLKVCYNLIGHGSFDRNQSPCLSENDLDLESGLGRSTDNSQLGEESARPIDNNELQQQDQSYTNEACMPSKSPRKTISQRYGSSTSCYNLHDFDGNICSKLNFVLRRNRVVKILLWGNRMEMDNLKTN